MRDARKVFAELPDKARLSNPRFPDDEDVLPLAVLRPFPTIDHRRQLGFTPDETRQPPGCDVEPAVHPARLHHAVQRHRLAHALERLRTAVLDHEHPGHQSVRRGRDRNGVGLGRALHARRDVSGLAEDLAAIGNHHRPGVDANPHLQTCPIIGGECCVEWHHRVHDRKPGANRSLGVVLARGGPAEVDEQPIAKILGNVATEARDGAGGSLLVLRDDLAPLLGVELLREWRRANQVAEENRQMAPLTGGCGAGCRTCQFWSIGVGRALRTRREMRRTCRRSRRSAGFPPCISRNALRAHYRTSRRSYLSRDYSSRTLSSASKSLERGAIVLSCITDLEREASRRHLSSPTFFSNAMKRGSERSGS